MGGGISVDCSPYEIMRRGTADEARDAGDVFRQIPFATYWKGRRLMHSFVEGEVVYS